MSTDTGKDLFNKMLKVTQGANADFHGAKILPKLPEELEPGKKYTVKPGDGPVVVTEKNARQ